jgi:hypothetical protein
MQFTLSEDAGTSAVGGLHHLDDDTPVPNGLARFWSAVLGWP